MELGEVDEVRIVGGQPKVDAADCSTSNAVLERDDAAGYSLDEVRLATPLPFRRLRALHVAGMALGDCRDEITRAGRSAT